MKRVYFSFWLISIIAACVLLTGCSGGQLVYTEPGGNVQFLQVQDAALSAGGWIQYQDDAGQWHSVRTTRAEYKGWCGDCCGRK